MALLKALEPMPKNSHLHFQNWDRKKIGPVKILLLKLFLVPVIECIVVGL